MSVCYHLNCHDCQEYIWIAQGSSCFYCGDPKVMEDLGRFLYVHERHSLSFNDDNQFDRYKDFQEKEPAMSPGHTPKEKKKRRRKKGKKK